MFTRIMECYAKSGMAEEATKRVRLEVLPILRAQPGFRDLITLRDGQDRQRVICLSFWDTKENADTYARQHYDWIVQRLTSLLESRPTLETLQVEMSTVHNI